MLSLEAASRIYTVASIITIVAAVISAAAGALTYISSNVISDHNDNKIATANTNSTNASLAAAEANLRAEELRQKNLLLSLQLQNETSARLETQKKLEQRTLKPTQVEILRNNFNKKPNQIYRALIKTASSDPEIISHAEQIANALESVGIASLTDSSGTLSIIGTSNTGVHLIQLGGPNSSELMSALKLSGIASTIVERSDPDNTFTNHLPSKYRPQEFGVLLLVFKKPPYIN